ncbi:MULTISPECIES: V-type ATP synthase subunit F [Caproicibacterium]|jgi:V/A-type H+-transporting ATPase subunit F|uniref:V-type ATP synthase subunit F n=1 Tax=Caproicibacterium lactatifermentans TaxID=2666138 RepID=A0A859DS53_9FIRM|nr:V-type ATP synthase subunit F [Caproicibacterium lactatifermentans]ARP49743.1 V-type ATP synthase subunit F [Ruminococcaceae bacterium CPB6]MDD4807140.1 V-type ATP synthase subunit F [Oscillospiraceae bacterium]QKN24526.1 V-type ATP synthase subunit F [Caproicibacterium lactatifermentans]QKO30460.1 V-type ATP synthase subunit F [Caproicibacterium lactatifermentans]
MYKVAVMGDWDSIYGFGALGLDTFRFTVQESEQAAKTLRKLAGENYAVIYVTEALAAQMTREIAYYKSMPKPAIILIPGIFGNTGEGLAAVKKSVEQAVGSDILFQEK